MKVIKSITILAMAMLVMSASSCKDEKYPDLGDGLYAELITNKGIMVAELFYDKTPVTVANFVALAEGTHPQVSDEYKGKPFYNGLTFHRVMDQFMIQGGDPQSRDARPNQRLGTGGPGYTLEAEIGAPHLRGALAAARTGGPSNPDKRSSGSQFYIVQGRTISPQELDAFEARHNIKYNEVQRQIYTEQGGTPQLDMEYTVFGEVVEGMDVVDQIAMTNTDANDRPVEDVRMNKVSIIK